MTNPFTYGNPISNPTRFFNRKREVELIFSRLHNAEFELSSIVGERRIGNTSLLKYLANPNVHHSHGFDPHKYLFVYIDLRMVEEGTTPVRLWQRLLQQIPQYNQYADIVHRLEKMRETNAVKSFMLADLLDSIADRDQYIVFLLDEFEHVTKNKNFGPDFFNNLRSLVTSRSHNLSLITSSNRELIELCHSEVIRSSPFFNIFANINLRLFTEAGAQQLILLSLEGTGVSFTDVEINSIFRTAGYHPYFLKVAGYFLFEAYTLKLKPEERARYLSKKFREQADSQISDYWHRSNDQEKIVLTTLALLKRQRQVEGLAFNMKQLEELYIHSSQTLMQLENRGLVISKGDMHSLFNASIGEWIYSELTNTMRDIQSYEEWLQSNKAIMQRLSSRAKKDIGEILPKISSRYRELIVTWVSDPRNIIALASLLRSALGFH